jgi:alkylhydroperoxidase family enzyme
LHVKKETLAAVLADWKTADISPRLGGALSLLECMTLRPQEIDAALMGRLKQAGLSDLEIREAAGVGFHYNMINRVADAFAYPVPTGKQKSRLAFLLNTMGKFARGTFADPVWVRTADGRIRPTEVEHGLQRMLSVEGATTPALRRQVVDLVAAQWQPADQPLTPDTLQPALSSYLLKLSLNAYKITDEDVLALGQAGFSKDAIYELTLVGSMSAALVGLEAVFAALYGTAPDPAADSTTGGDGGSR